MSGGHFENIQYIIEEISNEIERILKRQGEKIPIEETVFSEDWYREHPEDKYYEKLSDNVQNKFKEAVEQLKRAYVYVQRIDWYLSGDDSEETFLERLEEDLTKLKQ